LVGRFNFISHIPSSSNCIEIVCIEGGLKEEEEEEDDDDKEVEKEEAIVKGNEVFIKEVVVLL